MALEPWEDHTSTEWMDGIRTEEEYINRHKMVILCADCNEWHHFERDSNTFLAADGQVCACGSTRFIGSTIISERTWSPDRKPKLSKTRRK